MRPCSYFLRWRACYLGPKRWRPSWDRWIHWGRSAQLYPEVGGRLQQLHLVYHVTVRFGWVAITLTIPVVLRHLGQGGKSG